MLIRRGKRRCYELWYRWRAPKLFAQVLNNPDVHRELSHNVQIILTLFKYLCHCQSRSRRAVSSPEAQYHTSTRVLSNELGFHAEKSWYRTISYELRNTASRSPDSAIG